MMSVFCSNTLILAQEAQISNNFWGGMPPDPSKSLRLQCKLPPLHLLLNFCHLLKFLLKTLLLAQRASSNFSFFFRALGLPKTTTFVTLFFF